MFFRLILLVASLFLVSCSEKDNNKERTIHKGQHTDTALSSSVTKLDGKYYYLGNTEININGDEGCYLYCNDNEDTKWLSYKKYGRGIYNDGEKLLFLAHDEKTWYISSEENEKNGLKLDILEFDKEKIKDRLLNICLSIYKGYAYVLTYDITQDGNLPREVSSYGNQLLRYSLKDGSCECIWQNQTDGSAVLKEECIFAGLHFNDDYLAFFKHSGDESGNYICVIDINDLKEVSKIPAHSMHFALDEDGTVYYGCFVDEKGNIEGVESGSPAVAYCEAGSNKGVLLYADNDHSDCSNVYDVVYNGNNLLIDNRLQSDDYLCMLDGDEVVNSRNIKIIDLYGNFKSEIKYSEIFPDGLGYLVADILIADKDSTVISVPVENRKKIYINDEIGQSSSEWFELSCGEEKTEYASEIPINQTLETEYENIDEKLENFVTAKDKITDDEVNGIEIEYTLVIGSISKDVNDIQKTLSENTGVVFDNISGGKLEKTVKYIYGLDRDSVASIETDYTQIEYYMKKDNKTEKILCFFGFIRWCSLRIKNDSMINMAPVAYLYVK